VNKLTIMAIALLVSAQPAFASFTVIGGEDAFYGNAQSPEFTKSIDGQVMLGQEDQEFMDAIVYKKLFDRFYVKVDSVGTGLSGLTSVSNRGSTYQPYMTTAVQHIHGNLVALGYQWKTVTMDLEYVNLGKVKGYNPNPMVKSPPVPELRLRTEIHARIFQANLRYFFKDIQTKIPWLKVQPYILGGAGYGHSNVLAQLHVISTGDLSVRGTKSRAGYSLGLGGGFRGRLSEHVVMNTAARLQTFPGPRIGPLPGALSMVRLQPKVYWAAIWTLGLEFVF